MDDLGGSERRRGGCDAESRCEDWRGRRYAVCAVLKVPEKERRRIIGEGEGEGEETGKERRRRRCWFTDGGKESGKEKDTATLTRTR
jgi:hypothetical protein